jgi:hypothetical protein
VKFNITAAGYLHIPAEEAVRFPTGTAIALVRGDELWIMPMSHLGSGGLLLKIRNSRGDRSIFIQKLLPEGVPSGVRDVAWDEQNRAFRIPLFYSNHKV